MAKYDTELLDASERLLARDPGQKGKLASARIRRSISTSYYALFHFLLEETGLRVVGSHSVILKRRRVLSRTISHKAAKTALDKVKGAIVDVTIAEFLRSSTAAAGDFPVPLFIRSLAGAFLDAQVKRHDADYDMNKALSEVDACALCPDRA